MKKIVLFLILTLNFSLLSGCPNPQIPPFTPCGVTPSATDNNFNNMKCLSGDCVNGRGISNYSNGNKYEGNFKEGKFDGQGTLTYSNGSIYLGQFSNNEFNGKGLYIYCDKTQTYAEWKDGKQIIK